MAKVLFLVTVLFYIQYALGNVHCKQEKDIKTCDECIRCGGYWCSEPGKAHCSHVLRDNWCTSHLEILPQVAEEKRKGAELPWVYVERTATIMESNEFSIIYNAASEPTVDIKLINSTQSSNITLEHKTKYKGNYKTTIIATPDTKFCLDNGTVSEVINVQVELGGFKEKLDMKYHVPCACQCSSIIDRSSATCNRHGDLSCGVCTCHPKWTGAFCETFLTEKPIEVPFPPLGGNGMPIEVPFPPLGGIGIGGVHFPNTDNVLCPEKRGDLQCNNPTKPDIECSGNGRCGPCETCICDTNKEGAQYFDPENFCSDLCMLTNECEECLANRTIGECPYCNHYLTIQPYNATVREEMDGNLKAWVKCNETIDQCLIEYVAKKTYDGQIFVMIEKTCSDGIIAGEYQSVKVPLTLGILGMVAAIAAVAGVMYYKHLNGIPAASPYSPDYSNIDAEDCTGINPLYKPPTTKFTNPTYGKIN